MTTRLKRPPAIHNILQQSDRALSIAEIASFRHDLSGLTNNELEDLYKRIAKYIGRLQTEGRAFKARREDGTQVWSDSKHKIEADRSLDYYRLPLRDLLQKLR